MTRLAAAATAAPAVLAAALAACAAPPALDERPAEVVGAELATGDPGVVALVTSSGRVFCTGTLVAPTTILTAAHCIAEAGGDPAVAAFFGNDTQDVGTRIGVVRYMTHPGWTGDLGGGHDLALLLLAAPQPVSLVVPMNTTDLAGMTGVPYRAVGFGIHDRETRIIDGKKRTGAFEILGVQGDYVEVGDVDADGATSVCQGDSGGPGFITVDGVEVVAGVHSYSIVGCFNPSGDARPDLYLDTFIRPWIDANDPTCRADGTCVRQGCAADPDCLPCGADGACATEACALPDPDCPTSGLGEICQADTQCMSGECLAWPQDPHSQYCTQPCAGPADCAVDGMTCDGGRCVYRGEPPGALGQACEEATDCSAYVCAEGVCTYACSVPRGMLCPDGYECDTRDDGQTFRCWALPDEGGGCCGSAPDPGAAMALAAAVLAALGRRRKTG